MSFKRRRNGSAAHFFFFSDDDDKQGKMRRPTALPTKLFVNVSMLYVQPFLGECFTNSKPNGLCYIMMHFEQRKMVHDNQGNCIQLKNPQYSLLPEQSINQKKIPENYDVEFSGH